VVARDLLGRLIVAETEDGRVAVRLTEVEAYAGQDDPASHAFRGPTPRTAVMFGPAGHLYTYFVYGMHWCANVVAGRPGMASAVLLRAGEVVEGLDVALARRPRVATVSRLARGPAGLATVLGFTRETNGADLCVPGGRLQVRTGRPPNAGAVRVGPRVGVATAAEVEQRYWIAGHPTVSEFRAWTPRRRTVAPAVAARESGRPPVAG